MRVVIDRDLCQGHGACMGEAPTVFSVTPKGVLTVLIEQPDETLRVQVEAAALYCPTGAISIKED
jgi:sterol 14-demethylase